MLRLNPTQIKLEKRDIDWHVSRHDERQSLRVSVPSKDVGKGTREESPKKQRRDRLQDESPRSRRPFSSMQAGLRSGPDTEIFSDDPVPRGSRAFWDRVLAEAGTPTRVQTASMATATVVQPSDDFLNSTHSSKGSIESVSIEGRNRSDDIDSPSFEGMMDSSSLGTPYPSESSVSTRERDSNAENLEQRPPPREITQSSSPRSRLSFFPFRRKSRPEPNRSSDGIEIGHVDHSLSGSMAVDGPSDRRSASHREISSISGGGSGSGPDIDDGLYGNRRDRRTISQAYSSHEDQAQGQDTHAFANERDNRNSYPPPRAIGHSRNYSASVPRSSLYISETAASSSPERRPRTPTDRNPSGFESQGLLSLPPRRPRMYRQRSQTYSYAESEGSPDLNVSQMDGASTVQALTERIPSLLVSQPPSYPGVSPGSQPVSQQTPISLARLSDNYLPSSPPEIPGPISPYSNHSPGSSHESIEIRSYHSRSSILSSHSRIPSSDSHINSPPSYNNSIQPILPRRSLSPYAAPFVPRSVQRNASPHLALPPPFSATARNVSFSNSYPPSSPASPHTPPPQRQPSSSISPANDPSHLRIPIYNDNLDPATQPQTPVGLPRHGVPAMHTQNAAYTLPARGMGRPSSRAALADWQAFATPTRRPAARGRNHSGVEVFRVDQENAGAISERERRLRREREAHLGGG